MKQIRDISMRGRLCTSVALLTIGALSPVAAQAQSTETAAAPDAGSDSVAEIIVTAQRRTQNLQEVPIAVTALSPAVLEQRNIATTQDLMQVTPGLQVSTQTAGNGGGSATFFLRGMGQQRAGNGSEPAVGVYVDDIYYPALQGTVFSIVDLEQVEVLRGPQGTLFGRNTIGGAIRYTTSRPSKEFAASATATYGSYDRIDVQGVVNLPLGDIAAIRLTGGHLERDGYVKRANGAPSAGATKTDLVRAQLRLDPTDALSIDLSGQYSKDSLEGFPYVMPGPIVPRAGTLPFTYNTTPAGIAAPYDDRFRSACDFCQAGPDFREFNVNKVKSASSAIIWDASDAITLKSLTGWTKVRSRGAIDYDGSVRNIAHQFQSVSHRAFSQEFQLNAKLFDDRLNAVAGLFYYKDRFVFADGLVTESFLLGGPVAATPTTRKTENIAAFADISFAVTDKLTLLLGGRASQDDKDAIVRANTGLLITARSKKFSSQTGRIGVKYQWNDDVMTYASISEGFRAGGFNYLNNVRTLFAFDPETSRSFEAGARLELFDRHVRFNPTVFYTKWKDIQLQSVEITPAGNIVRLDNAGKAHTYGVELEAQVVLSRNFELFGNLATLHAEYDNIGAATGITLKSKFQRAPKLTYTIGGSYRQEVAGGFKLAATVNYNWQDTQTSTPTDTDLRVLPSYGLLGARIEVTDPSDRFTVALFGTNLADKVSYIGGVSYDKNVGAARQDLGRPREFGVSIKAKY